MRASGRRQCNSTYGTTNAHPRALKAPGSDDDITSRPKALASTSHWILRRRGSNQLVMCAVVIHNQISGIASTSR